MTRLKIYMELAYSPFFDAPVPWGSTLDFGTVDKDMDYSELVSKIDMHALANYLGVPDGSISIISPGEYAAKYGDENGGTDDEL